MTLAFVSNRYGMIHLRCRSEQERWEIAEQIYAYDRGWVDLDLKETEWYKTAIKTKC